jgi:hypothetical protein
VNPGAGEIRLKQTQQELAMTFRPALWKPIAIVLSAVNLVAVGFAAGAAEPYHAATHAALGLAFGLWAQRLRLPPRQGGEVEERLDLLEGEVSSLRRELTEAQERMDFAERLLVRGAEARRADPQP